MQEYLCNERGFIQYEISNFAKSEQLMSKHNCLYWEGDAEFAAFGNSASSFVEGRRFARPRSLAKYYRWVESRGYLSCDNGELDSASVLAETVIMTRLRTLEGLKFEQISPYVETQKLEDFKEKLQHSYLVEEGLIHLTG